jgi:hypothetical protein
MRECIPTLRALAGVKTISADGFPTEVLNRKTAVVPDRQV